MRNEIFETIILEMDKYRKSTLKHLKKQEYVIFWNIICCYMYQSICVNKKKNCKVWETYISNNFLNAEIS